MNFDKSWVRFFCHQTGLVMGAITMWLIAKYEHKIADWVNKEYEGM